MNFSDISKRHVLNETEILILEEITRQLQNDNIKLAIRDLAKATYVSTTTIIKMAKKMGFQGYSQMIYSLNESIHRQVDKQDTYAMKHYLAQEDIEIVEVLAQDIYEHRKQKIYLVGLGFSSIITTYFMKRLAELDILAYDGAPIDSIVSGSLPSILVFFSKTGETEDLIQICKTSKHFHHRVYTITTNKNSSLASLSDHPIILNYRANALYDVPDYYVGYAIFLIENILALLIDKMKK